MLAATVWVGGQFTVLGLLPTVRAFGEDAPKAVGRALARLLWPAYAVLVVTGFWNIGVPHGQGRLVGLEGGPGGQGRRGGGGRGGRLPPPAATSSRRATAVWGAVGAVASVAALCLGVFLAG